MDILGKCFGVRIEHRNDAPNDLITLLVEDDGNWLVTDTRLDAGWIDDLISVLQSAKQVARVTYNTPPSEGARGV